MASQVDIANRALSKLGESRIISFDDDSKPAREISAAYEYVRDAEFRAHRWHFTKKRIMLPALTSTPIFGWEFQYQLPADYLQVIQVGYFDPIVDMSDYRTTGSMEWEIEADNVLLTNSEAPLPLRYVARITDTTRYDATFIEVLASRLAVEVCEALTQSTTKKESARQDYKEAMSVAIRSNSIELPPKTIQDDAWVLGRI